MDLFATEGRNNEILRLKNTYNARQLRIFTSPCHISSLYSLVTSLLLCRCPVVATALVAPSDLMDPSARDRR